MHHKRGKPKNSRSGCLCCKRHKVNGFSETSLEVSVKGFASLRDNLHTINDLKESKMEDRRCMDDSY